MRKSISKIALAATLGIAITFTFSCSTNSGSILETYTVTYIANGGTGAPVSQTKTHDVSLTLSGGVPARAGYAFAGWNTAAGGNGTSYASGASYTDNASVILYAQWIAVDTLTDSRDGQSYVWVKIGTQTWMAENLNYNADGSKCYNNSDAVCATCGRLYNWSTAMAACPSGWHLPSDAEWDALMTAVGGASTAGTKLKSSRIIGNSTDDYGFSALNCGHSDFIGFGGAEYGNWWSATDLGANSYSRSISIHKANVERNPNGKGILFSVRCVKGYSQSSGGGWLTCSQFDNLIDQCYSIYNNDDDKVVECLMDGACNGADGNTCITYYENIGCW